MKIGKRELKQIILEVLCEGEVIYPNFPDHRDDAGDDSHSILDLEDQEELQALRNELDVLRGKEDQILRDIMSQTKEDDKEYPEDDEEFERYLAGIQASQSGQTGKLIDILSDYDDDDDDALSEQRGEPEGTHGGPAGDPVPYGEDIYAENIDENDEIHEDSEVDDSTQMASLQLKKQLDVAASNKYGGSTDDPSVAAAANAARSRQRSDTTAIQKLAGKYMVGE